MASFQRIDKLIHLLTVVKCLNYLETTEPGLISGDDTYNMNLTLTRIEEAIALAKEIKERDIAPF